MVGVIGSLGQIFYDIVANDKTGPASTSAQGNIKNTIAGIGVLTMAGASFAGQFSADVQRAYLPFDKAMTAVKSLGVLSNDEFTRMQKNALDWSTQYGLSAEDVANAMYSMVSVGYDYNTMMKTVPEAAKMAVGGNADLSTSMNAVINVMAAYGDEAGSAAEITDILAASVGVGKYELNDFITEMMKSIGTASNMGISFRDLATYTVMLQNYFVTAEEAGTSFNSMLVHMTTPKAVEIFNEFGISLVDTAGKMRPLVDIMGDLEDRLDNVNDDTERAAILHDLFGTYGQKAAIAIMNEAKSFKELSEKVQDTNFKTDAFNTVIKSGSKQVEIFEIRATNAKIAVGESGLAKGMNDATNATTNLTTSMTFLPGPLQYAIGLFGGLASQLTSLGPLLIGLGLIFPNIGATISAALAEAMAVLGGFTGTATAGAIGLGGAIAAGIGVGFAGVWVLEKAGILKALSNLGQDIQKSPMGKVVMDALKVTLAPISSLGAMIIDVVRGDFDKIPEHMIAPFDQAGQVIAEKMLLIVQTIQGAGSSITDAVSWISTGISSLGSAAYSLGSDFSNAVGGVVAGAYEIFSGIGTAFGQMAEEFTGVFSMLMGNIQTVIQSTMGGFVSLGHNIIVSLVNGIIAGGNLVISTFQSIFGNIASFFGGLTGGGGGARASGGPVAAGTPYLVGEQGPEMFVPAESGMIVPNSALPSGGGGGGSGGGDTINIASGAIVIQGAGKDASEIADEVITRLAYQMNQERKQRGYGSI